jgi:hypothetical protein
MMDQHSPDFPLLTETPTHPHSGAPIHALRDRGYRIHHHPSNAPFQQDGLPEARLPDHSTHPGGGCWLAYKKHASWTPLLSPLTLPHTCLIAPTCVVELTLLNGTKAAIILCNLPHAIEAHAITCDALSQLPHTLMHSLIILGGGGLQGGWEYSPPKDIHITALTYKRWAGPMLPTFTPRQYPLQASCIDHLTICDPKHIWCQTEDIVTVQTAFMDHEGVVGTLHLPIMSTEA